MGKWIFIDSNLLISKAYGDITHTAALVLAELWMRRVMRRVDGEWVCVNDGQISYRYEDAEKKGISSSSFNRAIKDLVDKGFLDIAGRKGRYGATVLYALSDRWKWYGTEKFVKVEKEKKNRKGTF